MKAYKVTLLIIDHDKVGPDQTKAFIESARYVFQVTLPSDIRNPDTHLDSLTAWLWERGVRG